MKPESKFVGHSTEIIRQSKIKGPLDWVGSSVTQFAFLLYRSYLFTYSQSTMPFRLFNKLHVVAPKIVGKRFYEANRVAFRGCYMH